MARFNQHHPHAEETLAAAAYWRDRCLISDGSVFTDRALWAPSVLDEVSQRFSSDRGDEEGSFQAKLQRQFRGASNDACQLLAEMLWLLNLFVDTTKPTTKIRTVIDAWGWSGETLSDDHPMLTAEVLSGIGSAGQGYNQFRPRELAFLIAALRDFKGKSTDERTKLTSDAWAFARWLEAIPDGGYRQLRHILPFLLFPDTSERIASPGDIRQILIGFDVLDREQIKQMSKLELDEKILELRRRLEAEHGGDIDFYLPKFRARWKAEEDRPASSASPGAETQPPGARRTPPLNQILYGPPGTGKTYRTIDRALEILDPEFLAAHAGAEHRSALKARFDAVVAEGRIRFVTFHQSFSYEDFVEGLRAEARADGSIHYHVADGILKSLCTPVAPASRLQPGTQIANSYVVQRSTPELLWLRKPNGSDLPIPWEIISELERLIDAGQISVDDIRKRTVFDRVPDTKLERYLINGYDNVLARLLETLRAAPAAAPADAGARVLIIDEINRGNIAKIFGELITLLEPSKRAGATEGLPATLPYSKQPFTLPGNLYVIGTMNTADRSLASIDMALRRRFVFEEVEPEPDALAGITIAGVDLAQLLDVMNARISALLDRDHRIGHAYLLDLRSGDAIAPLRDMFVTRILPLLQEYFFDDWQRIRLVLNDHRKADHDDRFIIEAERSAEQLFGSEELATPTARLWELNPAALERPSAYRAIIG